jgi:hypothetical protein
LSAKSASVRWAARSAALACDRARAARSRSRAALCSCSLAPASCFCARARRVCRRRPASSSCEGLTRRPVASTNLLRPWGLSDCSQAVRTLAWLAVVLAFWRCKEASSCMRLACSAAPRAFFLAVSFRNSGCCLAWLSRWRALATSRSRWAISATNLSLATRSLRCRLSR